MMLKKKLIMNCQVLLPPAEKTKLNMMMFEKWTSPRPLHRLFSSLEAYLKLQGASKSSCSRAASCLPGGHLD